MIYIGLRELLKDGHMERAAMLNRWLERADLINIKASSRISKRVEAQQAIAKGLSYSAMAKGHFIQCNREEGGETYKQ